MSEDWPHQTKSVLEIFEAFDSGARSVCLQLATGGGKSRIIRRVTERYRDERKSVYLVVHRKNLVRQLADELFDAGIQYSIVSPEHPRINTRIKVCSLMTLVNRASEMMEPEIIMIDEAHHSKCASYLKLLKLWPDVKIIGYTATPRRTDGSPLRDIFEVLIPGPPMRELIRRGILCDYDYYAPEDLDMTGVRIQGGEFQRAETERRVDKATIIGSAVENYRKYADHHPAIISCVSIAHAEHVATQFQAAGYRAVAVHSRMEDAQIRRAIEGLKSGKIELISQCSLIDEGVNIPGADTLIMLAPSASLIRVLQIEGRVLRGQLGKKAVMLDHVSNYLRHGLPDDPREWSLDGAVKDDRGKSNYKRCPECIKPVPLSVRVCPYCGYVWPESSRELPKEGDGRLVNIREQRPLEGFEHVVLAKKAHERECVAEIIRCARSRDQAAAIAERYGYKPGFGWFILQNKSKFHRRSA